MPVILSWIILVLNDTAWLVIISPELSLTTAWYLKACGAWALACRGRKIITIPINMIKNVKLIFFILFEFDYFYPVRHNVKLSPFDKLRVE